MAFRIARQQRGALGEELRRSVRRRREGRGGKARGGQEDKEFAHGFGGRTRKPYNERGCFNVNG